LGESFEGKLRLSFHLAPPGLSKPGPDGRPKKITFGPWLLPVLKWLAKARQIRGSWLDPFRFSPEKAVDRRLLADYEADLDLIASIRNQPAAALQLANWPAEVRGFGPIRSQAAAKASQARETARAALVA
jgi:indolepyruvate ferredoxin oxidoreductase